MTLADTRAGGHRPTAPRPQPPAKAHPSPALPDPHDAARAQWLRDLWSKARDEARSAPAGSPAFARVADLAASFVGMALRIGERQKARAVVGDALATLRSCCVRDRNDPARHLALARTLELAAACEAGGGDARGAFDALRAAIATVAPFAARLRDRGADPLLRMTVASCLARAITGAARMIEGSEQRAIALGQLWDECRAWADAASGAADHAMAIEFAVIAAFALAAEETADSASRCLERCEDLRPHLDALRSARGDDAVVQVHLAAFCRLSADAWSRLGDRPESGRCLDEAERCLRSALGMPGADVREVTAQLEAVSRARAACLP